MESVEAWAALAGQLDAKVKGGNVHGVNYRKLSCLIRALECKNSVDMDEGAGVSTATTWDWNEIQQRISRSLKPVLIGGGGAFLQHAAMRHPWDMPRVRQHSHRVGGGCWNFPSLLYIYARPPLAMHLSPTTDTTNHERSRVSHDQGYKQNHEIHPRHNRAPLIRYGCLLPLPCRSCWVYRARQISSPPRLDMSFVTWLDMQRGFVSGQLQRVEKLVPGILASMMRNASCSLSCMNLGNKE